MKIPTLIHQIWVGGELPPELSAYARTWQTHHPDWEYRLWTSPHELDLQNAHLVAEPERFVPAPNVGQFVSDVMRYEILERFGGVYADSDFECLRSIEPLIGDSSCFATWEEQDRWIANGLMGATPHHPFIRSLVDGLAASVQERAGQRPNRSSGPQYLTRAFRSTTSEEGRPPMTVLAQSLIYPYSYRDLPRLGRSRPHDYDSYLVHHWNNKRREKGLI